MNGHVMRQNSRKALLSLALLVTLSLTFTACPSGDAKKAAQAAQDISVSINLAIETKRDLLAQGLITNAQAMQIDQILLELNRADRIFAQGVGQYQQGKLNKAGLVSLFAAVNAAIQDLNNKGVLQITDPKAKAALGSITAGLSVAASIVQGALGSAK